MTRQLSFLPLLLFLLALQACEDAVGFSLQTPEPQLVVHSSFTEGRAVEVEVSKSQSILEEPQSIYVLDAKVEIYEGESLLETLELVEPKSTIGDVPYYTTRQLIPRAGVAYTIHVEAPGCEPVSAKSKIPEPIGLLSANISGLGIQESADPSLWSVSYDLNLSFEDPGMEENFYHISLNQQILRFTEAEGDTLLTDSYRRKLTFSPRDNNNVQVAHTDGGLLLKDGAFDGTVIDYSLPLSIKLKKKEELAGKLFVELRAVSEEYFLYYSDVSRQREQSDSPFSEPVIVFDNIEGGHGLFAGYNLSLDSLRVQN